MENLSSTSSYLTDEAASTCPLLTPSPPTNALINANQNGTETISDNENRIDYELGKVLQNKLADISTPDEDLIGKSDVLLQSIDSEQLNAHKECTEVGETKSIIQLTYLPRDCDGYFFSTWNWPLIRKIGTWFIFSFVCALIAIVIGELYSSRNDCSPKLEWYQHPILSLTNQSNITEIIEHLRYLQIKQIQLPAELDKYEFLKQNFSVMFSDGLYLENSDFQKMFIVRQLSDSKNLVMIDFEVKYLEKVFNISQFYKNTPWFIWSLNHKGDLVSVILLAMLPGIPVIPYDLSKEAILFEVLKLRQTNSALFLNYIEINGVKQYNIEFLKNDGNILMFKRWYPGQKSFVCILNLSNSLKDLDTSNYFNSYRILIRTSTNISSEFLESNKITLNSKEALILEIE